MVEHKSTLHEVLIKLCEGFFVYPSMNVAEITGKYIRYSVQADLRQLKKEFPELKTQDVTPLKTDDIKKIASLDLETYLKRDSMPP